MKLYLVTEKDNPAIRQSELFNAYMRMEIGLLLSDALEGYKEALQGIRDASSHRQRLCWVIALAQYTAAIVHLEQGLKKYSSECDSAPLSVLPSKAEES